MSQLSPTQTAVRGITRVPAGHIVVSDKWRGSPLVTTLQSRTNILYEDQLGVVDFYPSSEVGVVYLTEGDLVTGSLYRRKLVKLRKANSVRGIVLAERTGTSEQYFSSLQKFTVVEIGLVLMPVSSQEEAGNILSQMVHVEGRPQSNQFRLRRKPIPIDTAVLNTLQFVPKLGEVKAKALLEKFHSIHGICMAPEEDLSRVIGAAGASNVKAFFTQPPQH